jgi:hypothetical protein
VRKAPRLRLLQGQILRNSRSCVILLVEMFFVDSLAHSLCMHVVCIILCMSILNSPLEWNGVAGSRMKIRISR